MARKGPNEHPGPGQASSKIHDKVRGAGDHGGGGLESGRWTRGYVGGECGEDNEQGGRFGEPEDWDGDEGSFKWMDDHMGLPIAREEISGHFSKEQYLHQGHNTGDWTPMGSGPAKPEKQFPSGPQGRDSDNPETPKSVKIPGTGNRPF